MGKFFITDLSGGLNTSFKPHRIGENQLAILKNCVFRNGIWVKRLGYTRPHGNSPDGLPIVEIGDFIKRNGTTYLFVCTTKNIYSVSGTTWTSEKSFASARQTTDKIFYAEAGDELYVTDGVNPIQKATQLGGTGSNFSDVVWDTTTDPQGNQGITVNKAKVILSFNSRLLMFNVDVSTDGSVPYRMIWTEVNDFDRVETYNFIDFDYSHSPIICAKPLASGLIAVYKTDSVSTVQNTGEPPFTPRFRDSVGLLSPKAVTDIPSGHFFVSNEGFFLFAGGFPRPIGEQVSVKFFEELNFDKKDNVYCFTDRKNREIYILYPTGTNDEPDKILVYNWLYDNWTEFTLNAYCGFYQYRTVASPVIYFGKSSGVLAKQEGTTDDGVAIQTQLRTKMFTSRGEENTPDYVQINRVVSDAKPSTSQISLAVSDVGDDTPSIHTGTYVADTGKAPHVDFNVFGRYVSVDIQNFDSVSEFMIEFQTGGNE